ncbi:BREX-1 system adenine-specific DNA-methyltransferase PglX [Dehalobacter sp. DCM]|uniref:BREX-1 system adenine-specific DNA-methyltransferase PglX n=1 Tax=Dehalobacter sp. DCM TaxID=2907827 RepID=UPI003081BDBE|nr:BREX-1 system adenine-specific DNA-methyltransferase PglX [Dehalobacter sp. DCM]
MNKTAIKNFAIWARNKLIADITYKAGLLGITAKDIKSPLPQSTQTVQFFDIGTKEPSSITGKEIEQRKKLVEEIQRKANQSDYSTAYKNVIEEVAYTWFNRLIAIRFMEVNDYLPTRIRVLSSEGNSKAEPDLVTHAMEASLDYSAYEKDRIMQLKHENKLDELFRMLFIKQCNSLNTNLPELFEKMSDYTELLLNVSFTDKDGVVYHLVNDITEDDFNVSKEGQVEIIGWLYQYYNEERKNEVINIYKGTIKKDDIPAATQLFTTDWVVRYMVDNSLGRYWIERNPHSKLSNKLKYFVKSKSNEIQYVDEKIFPEDLTIFDPCMGSGHILVYAFDVLMEIYKECGYTERDAAQLIIKNNIFGLDIDNRAYQLAYFAVMMKARSYDRRFLTRDIEPNVSAIMETNELSKFTYDGITNDKPQNKVGEYLIKIYKDAKEIGSLISVKKNDYTAFIEYLNNCNVAGQLSIESDYWFREIKPLMKKIAIQASIMSREFSAVCTNPPYMNKLEGQLKKFVVEEYKPYSGDLFSVFMYRNFDYCITNGYSAFMTPFVWMFIKTYENLRVFIINQTSITTLIQMEYSAFEEATVPICTFVLKNGKKQEKGIYIKLSDFKGGMEVQKQKVLEALSDEDCNYLFETNEDNFSKISGSPIAYWISNTILNSFNNQNLLDVSKPCKGIDTGDNNRFLRFWFEVSLLKQYIPNGKVVTSSDLERKKWFPYNKGGSFRKWYGNNEYLLDWSNNGNTLRAFSGSNLRNKDYYFKKGITWSTVTSGSLSLRYFDYGFLFDNGGCCLFTDANLLYIQGLLNSKVTKELMSISPTINCQPGDIGRIPIIVSDTWKTRIEELVQQNINICKMDWDSYETSWDFQKHPLLRHSDTKFISSAFDKWKQFMENQFAQLKSNEVELNQIFIEIYGLQNELMPEVEDKDVTVSQPDLKRDIRSFISYSVGCIFGRYSLDIDGLAYAGSEWENGYYSKFIPDTDNILPITDEEYFQDDILGLFTNFIKIIYGAKTIEENLDFIANALGNSGNSSREVIRNYFVKDFFKDHCKVYQKRPIYWLFDSGKHNGFKALVYMHRYDENTIGNLRIDYLHRMQRIYENEIARMQDTIENSRDAREVTAATKRKEKLIKQLQETKEYDEKIAHLALARTSIDLDDGVKVNYEKVQMDTDGKMLDVLAKI